MQKRAWVAVVCLLAGWAFACCGDDDDDLCAGVDCGLYGECNPEDGTCTCDPGYQGALCDECEIDCGDHGTCILQTASCQCDVGYTGEACDECDDGYVPVSGECQKGCQDSTECDDGEACNGEESCDADHVCQPGTAVACGSNAHCEEPDGECVCDNGYGWDGQACARTFISTFDDLTLDPESYWNGSDESGGFQSGTAYFLNNYDPDYQSWDGFACSNTTDTTTPGFVNQYSAITGSGVEGSASYGVAYWSPWASNYPTISFTDTVDGYDVSGMYMTNTTYAYLSMRDGDAYAKQFGGPTGDDPDWFLLEIYGVAADASLVGPVSFYLADFRFSDNNQDYIVSEWTWVDLSSLGPIIGLVFQMSSSDTDPNFGMNTPGYFAVDNIMRHGR